MGGGRNILIPNGICFKTPNKILNESDFNIVGVGRLEEHKNFQLAIRALSKVRFDFKFYILGQGVYENELKNLIKSLNLENKIKLVGYVDNPWDYINSSNLQVLFSRLEGFSLALIEGIYYGKMVFALDTANHKEVLGDDFIVENDDEIVARKLDEVYENYDFYKTKFEKIKENSQKYSIENVANKYIKAYESLIK
ncbi:glycosyltransferase [Campylobacter sputorum]|uniref:glycosyltransferase n=1 Tax=Campylobacter sputorum TaxID=206 RepID=UPI000B7846E7|nr:glycosyltransferase [Campylobacter sputorum]